MAAGLFIHLNESECVKRVVRFPGDHVACCEFTGLLIVNDVTVEEPCFCSRVKPIELSSDSTVLTKRVWVMSAQARDSADTLVHLGNPGGAMVRLDDVIGRLAMICEMYSRAGILRASASLRRIAANAVGERHT